MTNKDPIIETKILKKVKDNSFCEFNSITGHSNGGHSLLLFIILAINSKEKFELTDTEFKYLVFHSDLNYRNESYRGLNALTALQAFDNDILIDEETADYLLKNTDFKTPNGRGRMNFLDLLIYTDNRLGFTERQLDYIIENAYTREREIDAPAIAHFNEIVYLLAKKYLSNKSIFTEKQIIKLLKLNPFIKEKDGKLRFSEGGELLMQREAIKKIDLFLAVLNDKNEISEQAGAIEAGRALKI